MATNQRGAAQPGARGARTKAIMGRPTLYKPEYCKVAVELGKQGKSITAIANKIGVTRESVYEWASKHADFADAIARARGLALEWWETTGQGQSRGKYDGGSAASLTFMMKNQFPDDYRDRREIDHSGELKIVELNFEGFDGDDDDD